MGTQIGKILLSEEAILQRVQELGQQISNDYRDRDLIIVCVLKGAVIFLADLLRSIDVTTDLDFVQLSSYGNGTESTRQVRLLQGLTAYVEGRDVLIVDDIVDSGLTLNYLRNVLLIRNPASLKICTLLDKIARRTEDIKVDYVGFEIPDEFIIGYGLDCAGMYRGLRDIAVLEFQA
jgi:hypoxanthine phosphoribosyltransferase